MEFKDVIRSHRLKYNMTLDDVSKLTGIPSSMLDRYEKGLAYPAKNRFEILKHALNFKESETTYKENIDLDSMSIGKKMKYIRTKNKLTVIQLACKLDLSQNIINSYENGYTIPDLKTLVNFSRLFNISLDYLILGEEPMRLDDSLSRIYNTEKQETQSEETLRLIRTLTQSLLVKEKENNNGIQR